MPASSSRYRFTVRASISYVSCEPRLKSLYCLWVYYQIPPLLEGQPIKANEPHVPGVSQAMLRQVPAVALSFWMVSRGYHVEVEVGLGVCATQWIFWPFMGLTHASIMWPHLTPEKISNPVCKPTAISTPFICLCQAINTLQIFQCLTRTSLSQVRQHPLKNWKLPDSPEIN